jgi:hypothetical protein
VCHSAAVRAPPSKVVLRPNVATPCEMARIGTAVRSPRGQDRDVALDEGPALGAGWSARVLRAVGPLDPTLRAAIESRAGAEVVEAIGTVADRE